MQVCINASLTPQVCMLSKIRVQNKQVLPLPNGCLGARKKTCVVKFTGVH